MPSPVRARLLVGATLCFTLIGATATAQQKAPRIHAAARDGAAGSSVLLDTMSGELQRAFTSLGKPGPNQKDADKQLPPYF